MGEVPKVGETFKPRGECTPGTEGFIVPFAIASNAQLSHAAKLLWAHLRWRAGSGNHCFPSQRDMGEGIGLDRRSARRAQAELVDKGFLRTQIRFDENGRRTTNLFEFLYHESFEVQALRDERRPSNKKGVQDKNVLYPEDKNVPGIGTKLSHTNRTKMSGHETTTKNHHHETQNLNSKSVRGSTPAVPGRREPEADGNADLLSLCPDDDSRSRDREQTWATAKDEVKAIHLEKTGEAISIYVLDAIEHSLATNGATLDEFVVELRKHTQGRWRNPAGFLRDLAQKLKRKSATASKPVTAQEAADANYRCEKCGSRTRGEGLALVEGKVAACTCATPEYIARQIERGTFATLEQSDISGGLPSHPSCNGTVE